MHTCQTIANYSSYSILSCSDCLEQCDTLYNHSAFCILECHRPTTTTARITTPVTTTPVATTLITTPVATAVVTTAIPTTTIAATTFLRGNTTTQTTSTMETNITATTPLLILEDNVTSEVKNINSSNPTNNKSRINTLASDVNKIANAASTDYFFLVLLVIPIAFFTCFSIFYYFRRKKTLSRRKSRAVLPLDANDVAINMNEDRTIAKQKTKNTTANDMIIKTVVASIVNEMIEKIAEKAKLPSVSDAAKTLKGLRLAKHKLLRQRQKRERGLQQLVLQNMQRQKKGMTIKEIFKSTPERSSKADFDII